MTDTFPLREEFLVSFCFAAEGHIEREISILSRFAERFDTIFRYWEIVYVLNEHQRASTSRFAQALSKVRNLRIIVVRDSCNFYRRRAVAVSEAIGDVAALAAFGETDADELAALAERVFATGEITLCRLKVARSLFSAAHWALSIVTGYQINANDLQTIVLPRARLNALVLRPTLALDLRFDSKNGDAGYVRKFVNIEQPKPRKSRTADRLELLEELISTAASRMLRAYAAVSAGVALLAFLYGLYAVGIILFKTDVQRGWFSTAIAQSGSVGVIAIGMTVIAIGLAVVAERTSGRSRNEIVDEIANISFFDRCTSGNVELATPSGLVAAATADAAQSEFARRGWTVPAFQSQVFHQKTTPYVTIIPVLNEGVRIQKHLRQIFSLGLMSKTDIVVVDGGSTDGSLDDGLLESTGVRALLTKTGPGKLSAQLRCGYAWALLEGYAGIVTIDGNGKDGVESIGDFLQALDEGFGYVQASRFIRGGHSENTPLLRLLAIRLFHAPVLSLAAGTMLTDTTQGYRAYSAAFLNDPRTQPFRDIFVGYELLAYLTTRASQIGYRVKELPTSRVYPLGEPVPTKLKSFGSLINLVLIVLKALFRAYHPKSL